MSKSGQDEPKHASFYGLGSLADDNRDSINYNVLIDAKTSAFAEKMTGYACSLAGLPEWAVTVRVMSPNAAKGSCLQSTTLMRTP
jgi:hypothetical protein